MTAKSTHSERLVSAVRKELTRRRGSLYALSKETGIIYSTLYFIFNPSKRSHHPTKGATFTFETGKILEQWLQKR